LSGLGFAPEHLLAVPHLVAQFDLALLVQHSVDFLASVQHFFALSPSVFSTFASSFLGGSSWFITFTMLVSVISATEAATLTVRNAKMLRTKKIFFMVAVFLNVLQT
jgi:hypothetical protein